MDMNHTKTEANSRALRAKKINHLLKNFGLHLMGLDPGILARKHNDMDLMSYNFDANEWAWLEPLLIELRNFRKTKERTRK
jgi:hypothetical protein